MFLLARKFLLVGTTVLFTPYPIFQVAFFYVGTTILFVFAPHHRCKFEVHCIVVSIAG